MLHDSTPGGDHRVWREFVAASTESKRGLLTEVSVSVQLSQSVCYSLLSQSRPQKAVYAHWIKCYDECTWCYDVEWLHEINVNLKLHLLIKSNVFIFVTRVYYFRSVIRIDLVLYFSISKWNGEAILSGLRKDHNGAPLWAGWVRCSIPSPPFASHHLLPNVANIS